MADNLTSAQRSYAMSRIRSKNSKAELMLRKALFSRGLRYRVHLNILPGKPDIVFTKQRVAIFVDGDFWHGWKFEEWEAKLSPYWRAKISGNIARDIEHSKRLANEGWVVLRFWEHEVKKEVENCVLQIMQHLKQH